MATATATVNINNLDGEDRSGARMVVTQRNLQIAAENIQRLGVALVASGFII